jgi:hypothetical protein
MLPVLPAVAAVKITVVFIKVLFCAEKGYFLRMPLKLYFAEIRVVNAA